MPNVLFVLVVEKSRCDVINIAQFAYSGSFAYQDDDALRPTCSPARNLAADPPEVPRAAHVSEYELVKTCFQ